MLTLFGEETATIPQAEAKRVTREDKQRRAYQATSSAWKTAVHKLAVDEFLPTHDTFLFEEFTIFYRRESEKRKLPFTIEPRAFAGIRTVLINEGLMEKVKGEFRFRSQGSPSQLYRSLIYRGK